MRARGGVASLAEYRIFETERFAKDLRAIARGGHERIERKLSEFVYPQLSSNPHFGPNIRKLRGWQPETWRYRIGSWRFFYEIDDDERIVFMLAASHRSSAY